ncbi:MAG TPA: hypothetical protein VNK95_08195 [Caldilineaceae bacterium]|nr:hypothetical protein [Caldilineaceae bacterium]
MDRTTPVAHSEEIELYIRTYYSLLRSSGPVRVRSLEETHAAMNSSLHQQADSPEIDVSALVYCALRLPDCIAQTRLMVMGQMEDVFRRGGYDVEQWQPVRARARRRKFYFNEADGTLAAFIASVSDIDDLIPCVTTFQIEWNKIHEKLNSGELGRRLQSQSDGDGYLPIDVLEEVRDALGLTSADFARLGQIWPGRLLGVNLQRAARMRQDMRIRVLGSGLSDYRRSVQYWWRQIEERTAHLHLAERPVYFVSSNVHSLVNLISGHAWEIQEELVEFVRRENPEGLLAEFDKVAQDDPGSLGNFLYYVSRIYQNRAGQIEQLAERTAQREERVGLVRVSDPHYLDVEAQIIELRSLRRKWLDPRLRIFDDEEWSLIKQSDALIFNIDYPLGMAAYHIFSQVSTALDRIQGVYILGKAATLNGRVGDVMIPNVVYDEHSQNSYLFRNCFTAQDVAPYLAYGTVFDNQKAVTVRGTILQNRDFMHVFYEEGYTDIEMEAGPYLSGIYEDIYPKRYPVDEIVNLFINAPYDIGLIHYASDTPISRRQTLLSKSLSYFGVDATYAASVAVLKRILSQEIARQRQMQRQGEQRRNPAPLLLAADGA